MSIAQFPTFSKLHFSHKIPVESITSQFEPYSDFNFTSLFSWDDGTTELCLLHDNLVIKIADYITGEPIYSVLGNNKIDESLEQLLSITNEIRLVPEVVVRNIKEGQKFGISEDRDNFDYVYSAEELALLSGQKSKRKSINRFVAAFGDRSLLEEVDLLDEASGDKLNTIFWEWAKERGRQDDDALHENRAISKLSANARFFNLSCLQISIDGKAVGFSIHELINDSYAICHFQKSILSYANMDVYLTNRASKALEKQGCDYINWEQDLGLPGLRELKLGYKPHIFLKKYKVVTT